MKAKNIILAAMPLVALFASCDNKIYEPINFDVKLSPNNTLVAGEPVNFDISGNANYVLLYTGEVGSEYQFANRTEVSADQIETCRLNLEVRGLYGTNESDDALDIYIIPNFDGLSGSNQDLDYATLTAAKDANYEGWIKLEYDALSTPDFVNLDIDDISSYADSFSIALHWNPKSNKVVQRSFYVNVSLEIKFKGYDTQIIDGGNLGFTTVMMPDAHADNRYAINAGNGYVNFAKSAAYMVMQGVSGTDDPKGNELDYCIDTWVVSTPRKLNLIAPDVALDLKSLPDDITEYTYTYAEPGEYTASFVGTSSNIYGTSREVKKLKFTIADNGFAEGDTSLGGMTEGTVE